MDENATHALKGQGERQRRKEMLNQPHIKPLIQYLDAVRQAMGPECELPCFDPCDGGVDARVLFLLEAPGRKAVGSGFISRNNPDSSAKTMNELLSEAGIHRHKTLLWNIVPWYVGNGKQIRPVNQRDKRRAMPFLADLFHLLPRLRAVVLVGRPAQSARGEIQKLVDLPIYECWHPSPLALNGRPHRRSEMLAVFRQVAHEIEIQGSP